MGAKQNPVSSSRGIPDKLVDFVRIWFEGMAGCWDMYYNFFSAELVVDKFRAERQKDTFRTLSNFSAVRLYIHIYIPTFCTEYRHDLFIGSNDRSSNRLLLRGEALASELPILKKKSTTP